MPNPTRETTGGRVYNDLRNLAKREGLSSADVMLSYTLERFLYRLAQAPEGGRHFVLKGGLLLAQFGARRATRDIDLLGRYFSGEDAEVIRRIKAIAAFPVDDGVLFDPDGVRTTPIRTDEKYAGLRLVMPAALSRAQLKLQLDISCSCADRRIRAATSGAVTVWGNEATSFAGPGGPSGFRARVR